MRHQVFATDTPTAAARSSSSKSATAATPASRTASAPARTPASAGSRPAHFAINAAWLELALTGIDLLAWTQHLLLDGELALAEPKKLRYRLLHVAARTHPHRPHAPACASPQSWPWADDLVTAFARLAALPEPVT